MVFKQLWLFCIFIFSGCVSNVVADRDFIGSPKIQLIFPDDVPNCVEGSVLIGFDVDKDGAPLNVRVIESAPPEVFDKAAIETVQRFRLLNAAGLKNIKYRLRYPPQGDCRSNGVKSIYNSINAAPSIVCVSWLAHKEVGAVLSL